MNLDQHIDSRGHTRSECDDCPPRGVFTPVGSDLLAARRRGGLLDLHEELEVGLGLLQALQEQLEGLLAVQAGANPRIVGERLRSLLPDDQAPAGDGTKDSKRAAA